MAYGEGQILVPDEGRKSARIVLIGEAPGRREVSQRRPFVGPSGRQLAEWWAGVGLRRDDFYITNFCPYLPDRIDDLTHEEAQHWIGALHERLGQLDGPVVIVPTGNYALYATTGKGKVAWHQRDGKHARPGITSHRGSLYTATIGGRDVTIIPTIHPAATFSRRGSGKDATSRGVAAQYTRACLADWRRIADYLRDPTAFTVPQREHYIRPTLNDVRDFICEVAARAQFLSLDIETPPTKATYVQTLAGRWVRKGLVPDDDVARYKSGPRKGHQKTKQKDDYAVIDCLGAAYDPGWSLTIPLTKSYWHEDLDTVREWVAVLLALWTPKILQNGFYDTFWLRTAGFPHLTNWWWDTRAMHHAYDPTDRHSLEYLASIFTLEPYWKDEAKDPASIARYAHGDQLWVYNGKDVCVTLEVFYRLHELLKDEGRLAFYWNHYGAMLEPLLEMSLHGIGIDEAARKAQLAALLEKRNALEGRLTEVLGKGGGISSKKLQTLLYEKLGLPKQLRKRGKTGAKSVTTDEVALKELMRRYPAKVAGVGEAILQYRQVAKQAEFVADGKTDADGRMRCAFHFYTGAGRLASEENPCGTGRNLQNIIRGKIRSTFVPDRERT